MPQTDSDGAAHAVEASPTATRTTVSRDDFKLALTEVLHEQRSWLVDVLREALDEDAAEQTRLATEARALLDDPRVAFPPVRGRA